MPLKITTESYKDIAKNYKGNLVSEISDSESEYDGPTIDESVGRREMAFFDAADATTIDESVGGKLMAYYDDDDATTMDEEDGKKLMAYYVDKTNFKSPVGKPLVRQAEAARAALAKMFGDEEVSIDPNWDGDTDIESEDENDEKEKEALHDAAEERISVMSKPQVQDVVVLGSGSSAVQVDPVASKMLIGMSQEDREKASKLIFDAVSQMRNAVDQVVPALSDPPVNIFVKSEGQDIPLTSRNVLDLRENGKFVDPRFFDIVAWTVAQSPNTSFEDKKKMYEWCMVVKGMFRMRTDLLSKTESIVKTETKTILDYHEKALVQIGREYSRYLQVCDQQSAEQMRRLSGIQGGLTDFSKFVSEGIVTLARQNATSNQMMTTLQGSVQAIEQNNLTRQENLYDGLTKSFTDVMEKLNNQSRDLSSTQEMVDGLKKEIQELKNQGNALSQEQREHINTLIANLTNMLGVMKEIHNTKVEVDKIKEELLEALSSIRTLNEAAEGVKAKTLYDRNLLISSGDILQRLSSIVPELKASADSVQVTASNYGKTIIENNSIMNTQLETLKEIAKSLATFEKSTVDLQNVQSERQQELLKAIQTASGGQSLVNVMAAIKEIADKQSRPAMNIEDVSNMIIEGVVNRIKAAAGGGAPPPPPPGGDTVPMEFAVDAAPFVPSSKKVVVSNRRGKVARAAKKTHEVSKKLLTWKSRVALVGKLGSRILGRARTATLLNGLLGGGAVLGHVMGPKLVTAILGAATGIGSLVSIASGILPAVNAISGYLAQYLAKYDERSSETNRQLGRQTVLLETAIAQLTELRGVPDGDRFNRAPGILRDLLSKIGEFKPIVVPPVMNYGRMEMMTPEERFRSVIPLAARSKPISTRKHGIALIKKNITDPALDNAVDYKKATIKRRATRVKKIEHRRTNDPLNKFFQGNW